MSNRTNIASGAKWESIVGYSRAVRIGNQVFVTGTVAVDENGNVVGEGDAYAQAQFILKRIGQFLEKAGATMSDVVRTRIFTTDISRWEQIGKAHGEVFRDILPCTTMVEVSALISPEFLLEIEADAIIES
ncbi:MAG: RidA family protein [Chitinophagales bacterium]|nr:RidA family protein [Bacteroidota bacterium]MBX7141327.1 RidA family protein [Chitinophagales bacterium]